jgi:hypothetical protein
MYQFFWNDKKYNDIIDMNLLNEHINIDKVQYMHDNEDINKYYHKAIDLGSYIVNENSIMFFNKFLEYYDKLIEYILYTCIIIKDRTRNVSGLSNIYDFIDQSSKLYDNFIKSVENYKMLHNTSNIMNKFENFNDMFDLSKLETELDVIDNNNSDDNVSEDSDDVELDESDSDELNNESNDSKKGLNMMKSLFSNVNFDEIRKMRNEMEDKMTDDEKKQAKIMREKMMSGLSTGGFNLDDMLNMNSNK